MPSARTTSVLAVGGLILGISFGLASNPVPETKVHVVKVPVTKTRVEEKKIYVQTPLPESCLSLVETMESVTDTAGQQTAAVGKILLGLQDIGRFKAGRDLAALTKATEVVREYKDRLDTAVIETIRSTEEVEQHLETCKADMQNN
jgi:hypothetical protein